MEGMVNSLFRMLGTQGKTSAWCTLPANSQATNKYGESLMRRLAERCWKPRSSSLICRSGAQECQKENWLCQAATYKHIYLATPLGNLCIKDYHSCTITSPPFNTIKHCIKLTAKRPNFWSVCSELPFSKRTVAESTINSGLPFIWSRYFWQSSNKFIV